MIYDSAHRQGDPVTTLLHLDSSASRSPDSVSRRLTSLFASLWQQRHGMHGYRYRDLALDPVELVGPGYCSLGQRVERHGIVPITRVAALIENRDEEREWALTRPLIEQLRDADTVLLGVPMYNFSIPASLKAWIDRITFPGAYTDPDTGGRLLGDTRVVVVTARGGAYGPGTPRASFDFQETYLRAYFSDLGVDEDNLHFVHAEMTRSGDIPALAAFQDFAAESLAQARSAVTELATPVASR